LVGWLNSTLKIDPEWCSKQIYIYVRTVNVMIGTDKVGLRVI